MRAGVSWLSTFCATFVSEIKRCQLGLYMRHRQCQWGAFNRITEGQTRCDAAVRRRTSHYARAPRKPPPDNFGQLPSERPAEWPSVKHFNRTTGIVVIQPA